ncbi:MAG: glutamine synthetase family protein, partial [Oscillospiraceae bacterium]|nr:glutamine synthetase family protein [Oscillospiraceae bacterium]
MKITVQEVLEFVKENDVKFIRLNFCDLFGVQKNISIMSAELPFALENGVSFDAHSIGGFRDITQSDLFLHPDPTSLVVLPWRPGPGRVVRFYCDVKKPDGSVYEHDSRAILKKVAEDCEKKGFSCKIGAECEFYLFKTDEDGEPTRATLDKGGYLDIAPLDRSGDIRREICLVLEEMGVKPESSHHEQGPGQNEIDFKFSDALTSADNLQTFKSVVKAIAARNGLFASFSPKPIPDAAGNGMHVNLSITQNGKNIFKDIGTGNSAIAESFIAGILDKTAEMTAFLNPIANSYERFGLFDAPKYISWSHQNRSQLIRIPAAVDEKARMELRSPDPSLNPYLAFAMIISAGLCGIENSMSLPPSVDADLYTADTSVT